MQSIDLTGRNGSSGAITIYHTAADFGRYFFRRRFIDPQPRALSSLTQTRGFTSFLPPGEIDTGGGPKSFNFNKYNIFHSTSSPAPHRQGNF